MRSPWTRGGAILGLVLGGWASRALPIDKIMSSERYVFPGGIAVGTGAATSGGGFGALPAVEVATPGTPFSSNGCGGIKRVQTSAVTPACTVYVAPITPDCSPATTGSGTLNDPYTNLYYALTLGTVPCGGTLCLRGGTYRMNGALFGNELATPGSFPDTLAQDRQDNCDDDQLAQTGTDITRTVLPIFKVCPSNAILTITNFPGEVVIIDGSDARVNAADWTPCDSASACGPSAGLALDQTVQADGLQGWQHTYYTTGLMHSSTTDAAPADTQMWVDPTPTSAGERLRFWADVSQAIGRTTPVLTDHDGFTEADLVGQDPTAPAVGAFVAIAGNSGAYDANAVSWVARLSAAYVNATNGNYDPDTHDVRLTSEYGRAIGAQNPVKARGATYVNLVRNTGGGAFHIRYGYDGIKVDDFANHVTFDGLTIDASGGRGFGSGIRVVNGNDITVRHCQVTRSMGQGINFYGGADGGGAFGIQLTNNVVSDNLVTNTGMGAWDGGMTNGNTGAGIFLKNCRTCTALHNTTAHTLQAGVQVNISTGACCAVNDATLNIDGACVSDLFTVVPATDIFTTTAHGFVSGDGPFYVASSGTLAAPLVALTPYYAHRLTADTYTLHTSSAAAIANTGIINITTTGTGTQTIGPANACDSDDFRIDGNTITDTGYLVTDTGVTKVYTVNAATDIFTVAGHGLSTGNGPFWVQATGGGTLATGLALETNYYVRFVDGNTFTLHSTAAGALANTGQILVSTNGTATQNLYTRQYPVPMGTGTSDGLPSDSSAIHVLSGIGSVNHADSGFIVNNWGRGGNTVPVPTIEWNGVKVQTQATLGPAAIEVANNTFQNLRGPGLNLTEARSGDVNFYNNVFQACGQGVAGANAATAVLGKNVAITGGLHTNNAYSGQRLSLRLTDGSCFTGGVCSNQCDIGTTGLDGLPAATCFDTGAITKDPGLDAGGTPGVGSPLINAGTARTWGGIVPLRDSVSQTRPLGAAWDIGWFETGGTYPGLPNVTTSAGCRMRVCQQGVGAPLPLSTTISLPAGTCLNVDSDGTTWQRE